MSLYKSLALTSYRLLAKYGKKVTIKREFSSYNPVDGETVSTQEQQVKAVIMPASTRDTKYFNDSNIILGDTQIATMSGLALDFDIQVSDKLDEFTIIHIKTYNPNDGSPILIKAVLDK